MPEALPGLEARSWRPASGSSGEVDADCCEGARSDSRPAPRISAPVKLGEGVSGAGTPGLPPVPGKAAGLVSRTVHTAGT